MKLENYFFATADGTIPTLNPNFEDGNICVIGEVYGKKGVKNGSLLRTSPIINKESDKIITCPDSCYELGSMNEDYLEMLKAAEIGKNILFKWRLNKEFCLTGDSSDFENREATIADPPFILGKQIRYILGGTNQFGEKVLGEVIGQNGNYVTLNCRQPVDADNEEYQIECFVVWLDLPEETAIQMLLFDTVAGIHYKTFEEAFLTKCRPKIITEP